MDFYFLRLDILLLFSYISYIISGQSRCLWVIFRSFFWKIFYHSWGNTVRYHEVSGTTRYQSHLAIDLRGVWLVSMNLEVSTTHCLPPHLVLLNSSRILGMPCRYIWLLCNIPLPSRTSWHHAAIHETTNRAIYDTKVFQMAGWENVKGRRMWCSTR